MPNCRFLRIPVTQGGWIDNHADMFDPPQLFIAHYAARHALAQPDKPCLICRDTALSWRDFDQATARVAGALLRDGCGRGDTVGLLTDSSAEAVIAYFGTLRSGATVAGLPTMASAETLATMVADSGARLVLASGACLDKLAGVAVRRVALDGVADGALSWGAWLRGAEPAPPAASQGQDIACLIYSSGTTGVPKGIALTQQCRLSHAMIMSAELRYDSEAVVIVTTPMHSNTAWTLVLCALFTGATMVIMPRWNGADFAAQVERWRGSHTIMVPTQFEDLLAAQKQAPRDLSSLRSLTTAGSSMRQPVKEAVVATFPCSLFEVYGLTEGFAVVRRPEDPPHALMSVGRAMMGNDVRLIDDDGRAVPPGQPGEIVGHGPILMAGYHNRPDETARMLWRNPENGLPYLRSGDIGRIDEHGYLYLVDRKKDMILSGGYNVFPADIELVLGQRADLVDLCVIGVPHPRWGETPLALVVAADGSDVNADELRDWANARLDKHQRLAGVEVRHSLPRNPTGKILRRELRAPYWAKETAS